MCIHRALHRDFICAFPQVLALWLVMTAVCQAVVTYYNPVTETYDPMANSTAPTGIYQDSGWAYQGNFGSVLGTMIGDQYFITAKHVGPQGSTFVSTAGFNGVGDITYTIDASANGGAGFWNIGGTDLRVYKINETFSSWAPLYTGSSEVGKTLVTFGRGGPLGAALVMDDPGLPVEDVLHGWLTTDADGVARWGANTVSSIYTDDTGDLLRAQFNAISGINEATLSPGDSGGGVFIEVAGQWYLAGVNYSVDGKFDTNSQKGDGTDFYAALFDMGGYYIGDDSRTWNSIPNLSEDIASSMYASRISASAAEIYSIMTPVPEPGSCVLVLLAGVLVLRRRRA